MLSKIKKRELKECEKNGLECLAILGVSIMCGAIYLYLILHEARPFTSDDAETPIHFYNHFVLGYDYPSEIKLRYLSIFNLLCVFTYKLLGCTVFASQLIFAERFALCVMIALLVIVFHDEKKIYNLIVVPVYVFMTCFLGTAEPGIMSSKFHTDPVLFFLLFLLAYDKKDILKKKYKVLLALFSIAVILQIDFLMLPIYFVPLVVYIYREELSDNNKRGILKIIVYLVAAGAIFLGIGSLLTQKMGVSISGFTGYGGKKISTVYETGTNIVIMLQGIADMFNASIGGYPMISLEIIAPLAKLCLILVAFTIMAFSLIKREKNVIYYCSLNVVAIVVTFILSGEHNLYDVRYLSSILFVLPLVLCIKIKEVIQENGWICPRYIYVLSPVICLFLGISQMPIVATTEMSDLQILCNALDNEGLKDGISSFWSANIVTVMSDYKQNVQAVVMSEDGTIEEEMDTWNFFKYKTNELNYVIIDKNMEQYMVSDYGVSEENVLKKYGLPEKVIEVGERKIYVYNYDLRNKPTKIYGDDFCVNGENTKGKIAKSEYGTVKNVIFQLGTYLIYVEVDGSVKKSDVDILVDNKKCSYKRTVDGKLVYELQVSDYQEINDISVYNNGKTDIILKNIEVIPVREALDIYINDKLITVDSSIRIEAEESRLSNEYVINKGVYNFVVYGKNIDSLNVSLRGKNKNVSIEKQQKNKTSTVYKVYVEKNTRVQFEIQNRRDTSCEVTNLSLEVDDECRSNKYEGSELKYHKGSVENNKIVLDKDGLQYGPYCELEKGDYVVEIYGNYLSNVDVWVTADAGTTLIPIEDIKKENERVQYSVHVDEKYDNVEFLVKNGQDIETAISYIIVRKSST